MVKFKVYALLILEKYETINAGKLKKQKIKIKLMLKCNLDFSVLKFKTQ